MKTILSIVAACVMLCAFSSSTGCKNPERTALGVAATVIDSEDAAMKFWADLSVRGKTTPAIDARVRAAHAKYQTAVAKAKEGWLAYKAAQESGGDVTEAKANWQAALDAIGPEMTAVIGIVQPLIK